jgi:N-dimethylarginine dimethylaminohydrolase
MDLYLMSPPHPAWSLRGRANFKSKSADDVDPARAFAEWLGLAEAIEARGGVVAALEPDDAELTGMVFAAEAGHPLPASVPGGKPRFLLPQVKPAHRRGERERWRAFVERLGFEAVDVTSDAIWEGQGDVASFDGATLLFHGGRTELRGMHEAKRHFAGEVLEIRVREPAFHGNMAVLPIPSIDAIIVCADVVDDDSLALLEARVGRDRMHFVSEEELRCYATNGLPVGRSLLCASGLPSRVRKLLERRGAEVVELPMLELCDKGGGASRCMVCVFTGAPDDLSIPDEARLASVRERRNASSR